jgi:hypothetical protein
MKRILCLAAATLALSFSSTVTLAQSGNLRLRFHASFPFAVENTTFAAGDYEVTAPAHLILELRNLQDQNAAFEQVQPARSSKEADGRIRFVFHRYDNKYFLAVISDGSERSTFHLRQSKQEARLADARPKPQMKIVSVLSDGTIRETLGK